MSETDYLIMILSHTRCICPLITLCSRMSHLMARKYTDLHTALFHWGRACGFLLSLYPGGKCADNVPRSSAVQPSTGFSLRWHSAFPCPPASRSFRQVTFQPTTAMGNQNVPWLLSTEGGSLPLGPDAAWGSQLGRRHCHWCLAYPQPQCQC